MTSNARTRLYQVQVRRNGENLPHRNMVAATDPVAAAEAAAVQECLALTGDLKRLREFEVVSARIVREDEF